MAAKSSNRLIYILGAIVLVLLIIGLVAKKKGWVGKPVGTGITVDKVKRADITERVSASGKVQPEVEVKISPDVSGEITELYIAEGDSVKKGQLLLKIKPDNYQSMVDMRIAAVNQAKANLAQARARLSQNIANNVQIKQTHQRNTSLYKEKVISQAEFETSKANFDVSQQEIESGKESVKAAEYGVQSAIASLKEARENLNKTTIYAPVSGTISKLSVERGERVVGTSQMAGTELLRIANLNTMEVRVNVNENDIVRVKLGDSVIVDVDSYSNQDHKFKGVVTQIANTAKDALTLEAVTEFEVRIRLLNESYKELARKKKRNPFRPGMTASVDIITDQKRNILTVPLAAVTTRTADFLTGKEKKEERRKDKNEADDEKKPKEELLEIVFLHENGKAVAKKVKTGISDFDNIEILEGLKEGQEVISGPFRAVSKTLKNNDNVVVKDAETIAKEASDTKGDDKE
ncbi:efflux RND transporter periplasmic adaptor subunit [Adhaeribacter terreus]|uniref:Efflux RND transporter periplasmic adaptor subunit n=1 Tax=Adhaeribacter terreus TaxID=529703 RepID=A0ABW0E7E1_9BACT